MKKVVVFVLAIGLAASVSACKKERATEPQIADLQTPPNTDSLTVLTTSTQPTYLYVTAKSGLLLRAHNNLKSERLARIPYGSRVEVLTPVQGNTMEVNGISGAMPELRYNHKTGYAFSGYLSKYFPPDRGITLKGYAQALQRFFPDVSFKEAKAGTPRNPARSQEIMLPEAQWHEAFFMAQQLFGIPKKFSFPETKSALNRGILDEFVTPTKKATLRVNGNADLVEAILCELETATTRIEITIMPATANGMIIRKTETVL